MMDRRSTDCNTYSPLCMTIGFMLGMTTGSLINSRHSLVMVCVTVVLATVTFHYTFVKNGSILKLFGTCIHTLKRFIKKGS